MEINSQRELKSKSTNSSQHSKKKLDLVTFTQVIGLVIPILYVIGRFYDESYLEVYGINNELFSRDIHDYLYFSLLSIIQVTYTSITSSDWSQAIFWSLVIPVYVGILVWLKPKRISASWRERIRKIFASKTVIIFGILSSGLLIVGMFLALGFFLILLILLPVKIGLDGGKQAAKDEIANDRGICEKEDHDLTKACTVVSFSGNQQMVGRIIAATESYIAVARDGEVRVFERSKVTLSSLRSDRN